MRKARNYSSMSTTWKNTQMSGKVVVITGANAGLGKASAQDLAGRGAKVYMLGRNQGRTESAANEIIQATGVSPDMIQVMILDLSSLDSVREFANKFKERETHIDVLMNNAGIMAVPKTQSADGYELQFATNVLGHYLLTHLLTDLLLAAAPGSRVVNLTSAAHKRSKGDMNWTDIMMENNYDPAEAYNQSKLGNLLFNLELSKRLKESGVNCYAADPGAVKTSIQSKATGCLGCIASAFRCCFKSPEDGVLTQIRCSIDPGYSAETGHYYRDCKRAQPSRQAQDEGSALRLWNMCQELVKLQPDETHDLMK